MATARRLTPTNNFATYKLLLRVRLVADGEIRAIRMVEDQRANAGFGVHHHAFREMDTNFFGFQEHPYAGLVVEIRAGGIAEAVTFAAVTRSETLGHGERGRIGEAPIFADASVQPFGAGFGGFDGESLEAVGKKITAGGFGFFGAFADSGSGGDYEEREMIALDIFICAIIVGALRIWRQDVIAQAKLFAYTLALEMKFMYWRGFSRFEEREGVTFAFGFEELPNG